MPIRYGIYIIIQQQFNIIIYDANCLIIYKFLKIAKFYKLILGLALGTQIWKFSKTYI